MQLNGILLVDKPPNMTSHDVVDVLRKATGIRRTTSEARNSASSAECTRARKSTSLVPSATRANLL